MLADAYATALMTMPFEKGKILINSLNNVEAMWVLAVKDSVVVEVTDKFESNLQ